MDLPTKAPGRPTKVSNDIAKRIASLLLQGVTEKEAAEASGIDSASFFAYLAAGKAGDPQFADFTRIITEAKEQRSTWRRRGPEPR